MDATYDMTFAVDWDVKHQFKQISYSVGLSYIYMYNFKLPAEAKSDSSLFKARSGPEVIKLFSCSAQLRLKYILLINVQVPTIVGILTFISRINY